MAMPHFSIMYYVMSSVYNFHFMTDIIICCDSIEMDPWFGAFWRFLGFVDVDNCFKVIKEHIIVFFMLCLRRSAGIG